MTIKNQEYCVCISRNITFIHINMTQHHFTGTFLIFKKTKYASESTLAR